MSFVFPASSLETLRLLSQIGVVLFMFIVGMELNVRHVKEKGSAAVMISHASIIVPFVLGAGLSLFLYRGLAPPGTSFSAFALFIGVAMSITAFPVLARILEDRGLTQTHLGSIAYNLCSSRRRHSVVHPGARDCARSGERRCGFAGHALFSRCCLPRR